MSSIRRTLHTNWGRIVCLIVCFGLVLSSIPVHFKHETATAQSSGLKSQLPPFYKLPNLSSLITEGKKPKKADLPVPPLKPSTICGYRDEACKRKKAKEKKVDQNLTPSKDNASQVSSDAPRKGSSSWLGRLGRAFSNALSGLTTSSARGNSFIASDMNRNTGNSSPAALNNTTAGAALVQTPPTFASIGQAMLDPRYRIGGAGEDLFSGNYNFTLPLVSLPGRAGLDLNITLSYNSLVWIKYAGAMEFEYDYYPSLTPGFRTGFPEIVPPLYISGINSSWLVYLPSGRRVEMRQVVANRFEAIDGSHLFLTVDPTDITKVTLYSTDGTQYKYEWPNENSGLRCTQVKDGNGNYISITYKIIGVAEYPMTVIDKVTDTLGRDIVFNYDDQQGGTLKLMSIIQVRPGQPDFLWAQFDYGMKFIAPNFGSLIVHGPNNVDIPVITRVITADRARYTFDYNSWGQVSTISSYGEADNLRTQTFYAFPGSTQNDCPRFYQRNDGIKSWGGQSYDAPTDFGWDVSYFYFAPNETIGQVTGPDGVTHKNTFSVSGGTRGLTTRTDAIDGGASQQFTEFTWVSNSTTSPPLRPRVTEIKIYDDRNHDGIYQSGSDKLRKTTIEYMAYASTVFLPWIVREYNEGGAGVYRATETTYVSSYLNRLLPGTRRFILPSFTRLFEGDQTKLVAQSEYVYDSMETNFLQAHGSAVHQHDGNYGTGFQFRGNLTKARRYSVDEFGTVGGYTETQTGYYITGNPAWTKDGENHETTISYEDSFLHYTQPDPDTISYVTVGPNPPNPPTYAYPTRVTIDENPADVTSTISYNYDFGAVTRTVDPKEYALHGSSPTTMKVNTFDSLRRPDKTLIWKEGNKYSQVRYVFATDHSWRQTWTTVNDLNEETMVLSQLDGVSRERITISDHPTSLGGLRLSYVVFDMMGRVSARSNPTEVNSNYAAWGDDLETQFAYSTQAFDWKGRPTITTNQDGTTKQISYEGCGCSGVDKITVTDEIGRKRITYRDVMGRVTKTEIVAADQSLYSTSTNAYDVRDIVTSLKQYEGEATSDGSCPSGTCQQTDTVYDGYGRLQKRYLPIYQDPNVNPPFSTNPSARFMSWQYDNNDRAQVITDPRQATTTYGYNNRGLVSNISYFAPAGVTTAPNVSFQYDELGNRTYMDDGPGYVNYGYDTLGRLESESRTFTNLGDPAGPFTISYLYNLAGQVRQVTDPFDAAIEYTRDKTGRLLTATGTTAFAGVTNYLSGVTYRAWDAVKTTGSASYGYDNRLMVTGYGSRSYQYDDAGQLTEAENGQYTQTFGYDKVGRLSSVSTPENTVPPGYVCTVCTPPPNGLPPGFKLRPFTASITYNAFGNVTGRTNTYWFDFTTYQSAKTFSATYVNNRAKTDGVPGRVYNNNAQETWQYNAMGEVTYDGRDAQHYDAAGRVTKTQNNDPNIYYNYVYDGDGKQVKIDHKLTSFPGTVTDKRYRIYSSVLGGLLTDVDPAGQKMETRVYTMVGNSSALQIKAYSSYPDQVIFETADPHGTVSTRFDRQAGAPRTAHISPVGVNTDGIQWNIVRDRFVGTITGYTSQAQSAAALKKSTWSGVEDPLNPGRGCTLDGVQVNCEKAFQMVNRGAALIDPALLREARKRPSLLPGIVVIEGNYNSKEPPYDYREGGYYQNVYFQASRVGGQTGKVAKFSLTQFADCLYDFFYKMTLNDTDAETKVGLPWEEAGFVGSVWVGTIAGGKAVERIDIDISKDSNQLGDMHRKSHPSWKGGQSGLFYPEPPDPKTFKKIYIASELVQGVGTKFKEIGYLALHIHEIGNALAETKYGNHREDEAVPEFWRNKRKALGINDSDAGAAFETCVFGGIVGLKSGKFGNNREWPPKP